MNEKEYQEKIAQKQASYDSLIEKLNALHFELIDLLADKKFS